MGYIVHHTISVTSMHAALISEARSFAIGLGAQVSELVHSQLNGFYTFVIAPDGSKEGWEDSDAGDERRGVIKTWLRARVGLAWFEVAHPEDGAPRVIDHQDKRDPGVNWDRGQLGH